MIKLSIAILPILILVISIFFSLISTNDKSPLIVLLGIFLGLIFSCIYAIGCFLGKYRWSSFIVTLIPIIYCGIIVFLGRKGYIDTYYFIGFR